MAQQQKTSGKRGERMLHIRMKPEMHKRVRVQAAEADVTIQDWVTALIERELGNGNPRKRGGTS